MIEFSEIAIFAEFRVSQKGIEFNVGIFAGSENKRMEKKVDSEISSRQIPPINAVVALQRDFVQFASNLRHNDRVVQDDLIQEMSLGVLQCNAPHTLAFFRSRAISRARDYLKAWRRKSCEDWAAIKKWPAESPESSERTREWYLEKISALMETQRTTPVFSVGPK